MKFYKGSKWILSSFCYVFVTVSIRVCTIEGIIKLMALDQVTYILIFVGHMICHKSRFTNKKYS